MASKSRSKTGSIAYSSSVENPEHVAKEICLRLLAVRSRTRAELTEALLRKGTSESVAERVLQRLEEVSLINDAEFAHAWVQSRHQRQGLGRQALIAQLRRKNIPDDIVHNALSSLDPAAEEDRARELVQRQLRRTKVCDKPKQTRRLAGMLVRKGYSPSLAFRIISEELEHSDATSLSGNLFDDDALDE